MEMCLWGILIFLVILVLVFGYKIWSMRKTARELVTQFAEKRDTGTNTTLRISSNDAAMNQLAAALNKELERLREKELRYEQGNRELTSAVTNISHDLRTPLTAISAYLELFAEEEISQNSKRYVTIIKDRVELMTKLTEELFRYSVILSKKEEAAFCAEPVVVNSILEESIAAFYTAFTEKKITPEIHMTEQKVVRTVDAFALSRVFSNLLNNALKYSDGDLCICMTDNGKITFVNSAKDLNEIQVGKLFDRFYTVEAAGKSTGLGLSIARTLLEQMQGTIRASYEDGRLCIEVQL